MKLFSFWRSPATYRVRIALNLKGLVPDEVVDVNLLKGAQREAAYRAVNPMMALSALIDGEGPILFESLAIIEYLDETHPNPPLLPRDARGRARVRGLAQIVACDSHPLIVPRVREYLKHVFKLDEPTRIKWCQHWHTAALTALEAHLKDAATGRYRHGDAITCRKTFGARLDRAAADQRSGRRPVDPRKAWRALSANSRRAGNPQRSRLRRSPPPPDDCVG